MKKVFGLLAAIVLLAAGSWVWQQVDAPEAEFRVAQVVDGDTIVVDGPDGQERVRMLGIDTPERGECLADDATRRLEELLPEGASVHLEYDQERTDRYGRTLAGVFRDGQFVNAVMVSEGLARVVEYAPNTKFTQRLEAEAAPAVRDSLGIYGLGPECWFTEPTQQVTLEMLTSGIEELERSPGDRGLAGRCQHYVDALRDSVKRTRNFTFREPAMEYLDEQQRLIDEPSAP